MSSEVILPLKKDATAFMKSFQWNSFLAGAIFGCWFDSMPSLPFNQHRNPKPTTVLPKPIGSIAIASWIKRRHPLDLHRVGFVFLGEAFICEHMLLVCVLKNRKKHCFDSVFLIVEDVTLLLESWEIQSQSYYIFFSEICILPAIVSCNQLVINAYFLC